MTYPVVEIEWLDAVLRSGSDAVDTHAKAGLMLRHTAGYLVGKTRDRVVIAMTDDRDGKVDDALTVPLAWVRKMRYLRKGRTR